MLSDEEIRICLANYGVGVSALQCHQVRTYTDLLLRWNRMISLTSLTDEAEILRFHFGESLFALSALKCVTGRLADVGAGGGFPGLPLRIFSERIYLCLIESNSKKCAFLNEVCRHLDLANTQVFKSRYEDLPEDKFAFDTIVARALGEYEHLLRWAKKGLTPGGRLILWLGEDDSEKIRSCSGWSWHERIPIPGSKRRFLLAGLRETT